MNRLYASPLRVYLLLGTLALIGIYSGLHLPISLFPNSSKPTVAIHLSYGGITAEEFLNTYGQQLESQLRHISNDKVETEKIEASYRSGEVEYLIRFKWGVPGKLAEKEVQTVANAFAARLSTESRDSMWVGLNNQNSGFLAVSFFSNTRELNELFDILEPILAPRLSKVKEAQNPILYNPSKKEIRVELIPEAAAALHLLPRDIEQALNAVITTGSGGSVTVGTKEFQIQLPRRITSVEDLGKITVPTPTGQTVHLSDVARVDLGPSSNPSQVFKTNGASSLILFATPRPGGNVKKMAEEILEVVWEAMPSLPKDVQYRVLVDPSEFIRSAVNNVFHEVTIAALLAVIVLFIFIGSVRNVITAAIEIPLSMVLAFILMRLSGMNLNLISLGGLALSAGMNVDASVVVMENIFRHFEMSPGPHDFKERLRILTTAVKEVQFAVIASTISSLVVFLPLTFTSDLSYAILGDLAKAVVFSHGFSAIVALILVPTVRLHLMSSGKERPQHSKVEKQLAAVDNFYATTLEKFIARPKLKWATYAGLACLLALLSGVVLPRLPKEVIGKPDTDWMTLNINTQGNALIRQMEEKAAEIERDLLGQFGAKIQYTFNEIQSPNHAEIMARLKNKHDMQEVWKAMQARYVPNAFVWYEVEPWNPSELPIPNPPHLRVEIRGNELDFRGEVAQQLSDVFREKKVFPQIWTQPGARPAQGIFLEPHAEQWAEMGKQNIKFSPADLADMVRVATHGRRIGQMPIKERQTDIILRYPNSTILDAEDVGSLPVGIASKIVPLKALAELQIRKVPPTLYREDERGLFLILGRENLGEESKAKTSLVDAQNRTKQWEKEKRQSGYLPNNLTIAFEDPAKDITESISQLSFAVGLSVALIFLTLLIQFGSVMESLLVLVSVPLGFIGVLISLFVFRSTLSLNSILGVILLNGIAVANSIILVDFIKRQVDQGMAPKAAAVYAARKRLRPILITSLTTVLGMLPVALGAGEGGRILQPLGIAVSGGLWISMLLTLFLVPAMQVSYLEWRSATRPLRLTIPWESLKARFRRLARLRIQEEI